MLAWWLLFSLCAYICSVQAVVSSATQQHLASKRQTELEAATDRWLQAKTLDQTCNACIAWFYLVKQLSYGPENVQKAALVKACQKTKLYPAEVCDGVVEEQTPVAREVLKTMSIGGRDGHLLCAAAFNSCAYPDVIPWNITFPKSKPSVKKHPRSDTARRKRTFNVLHLSDWHIDPSYAAGTEAACDKPICCRRDSNSGDEIHQRASKWGSYQCDAPLPLINSMLEYIESLDDIRFGLMTGDVPPHDVWNTLPVNKTRMIQTDSYQLLHAYFDDSFRARLYPTFGNHEAAPANLFPLNGSSIPQDRSYLKMEWLYGALKKAWKGWIPREVDVKARKGNYAVRPVRGLKIVSLNTNFCYTFNWWLYQSPFEKDPDGMLQWLIDQLQESEDLQERVWIMGHIAPGDMTCLHDFSNYYYQIVERYAPHVIVGQFFGHTHRDEFQIFYRHERKDAEHAIAVAYLAPSVTPFPRLNPGFRVYEVDNETFEIVDSKTYTANLDQADTWLQGPNWHLEYSARKAYNGSTELSLTPAWWHNVSVAMEQDIHVFDKYWEYRTKSSAVREECDDGCRHQILCSIRAGKSELRCDYKR
ncbi:Metallo-dependent phosphatase-like protein [Radiomyces spectabilis]|uniref:Metallo-dependent phosphatase-like protein n=1 Tax=Radiomyces spectabilis TaxID=64574 RepID=UPI002220152F|nr:Metallo-dependent phosphatase-like protein [Radiomyces spectabilis]KAI8366663.1 Metallo-dependent phosphatase-like protein [Radiomyces spectabilis]